MKHVGDRIASTWIRTSSQSVPDTGKQPETNRTPDTGHRTPKVIGIGNAFRRDDGVGLVVANKLADLADVDAKIAISTGDGVDLINRFKDASSVILIDAVRSGSPPGTIHRMDVVAEPVPSSFFNYSTHAFGVAEAIALARELGKLPETVILFGIEGGDFSTGEGLTPAVNAALKQVLENLTALLSELLPSARD